MKTKLLLTLAIVMGLVTTYLFYHYLKQFDVETIKNESMVNVVVAKQSIKGNQRVTSEMLELKEVPEAALHEQTIRELHEVVGKYTTAAIEAGEPLLQHRVKSEMEENLYVSRKVKEGYRAVSVGVNFVQSVSTLIEPEDDVDVIATEVKGSGDQKEVLTQLLLPRVRVLAVGRKMLEPQEDEEYVEYSSVTLELTATDAVRLVNAAEKGTIQLTLYQRVIESGEAAAHDKTTN